MDNLVFKRFFEVLSMAYNATMKNQWGITNGVFGIIVASVIALTALSIYIFLPDLAIKQEPKNQQIESITGSVSVPIQNPLEEKNEETFFQSTSSIGAIDISNVRDVAFQTIQRAGSFLSSAITIPQTEEEFLKTLSQRERQFIYEESKIIASSSLETIIFETPKTESAQSSQATAPVVLTEEQVFHTLYPDFILDYFSKQRDFLASNGNTGLVANFNSEKDILAHVETLARYFVSENALTQSEADRFINSWNNLIAAQPEEKNTRALLLRQNISSQTVSLPDRKRLFEELEKAEPRLKDILPPLGMSIPQKIIVEAAKLYADIKTFTSPSLAHAAVVCFNYYINSPTCFLPGAPGPGYIVPTPWCAAGTICNGALVAPYGCTELAGWPIIGSRPFLYNQAVAICGAVK